MSGILAGLTVLVTRPQSQAETLCLALEREGAQVVRFPTIQIRCLREPAAPELRDNDVVLFVSPNAVRCGLDTASLAAFSGTVIAMGSGTQAALEPYGITPLVPERPYRTETVLNMPVLQSIRGQRIAIVAGKGGRDALLPELESRGARVQKIEVYERIKPDADASVLDSFWTAQPRVIFCTSAQSVQNLIAMVPPSDHDALFATPLVVVSSRIREHAGHFSHVTVCESVVALDLINHLGMQFAP